MQNHHLEQINHPRQTVKGFCLSISLLSGLLLSSCLQADEQSNAQALTDNFIHLSDVHLDSFSASTQYGGDTGTDLWADTLQKLASVLQQQPKPRFIIYTGDLPAHYSCPGRRCYLQPGDRDTHNTNIETILNSMRTLAVDADVPLFYAPGNNDSLGGDYYSFTTDPGTPKTPLQLSLDKSDPYPALNAGSSCGTPPCTASNPHPQFGYYAARPEAGLRIIAMNSIILGHTYHSTDGVSQSDAGTEQLGWLKGQLDDAKASEEKVWLIMHIPPGLDAYSVNSDQCPGSPSQSQAMWAHLPRPTTTGTPVVEWQDSFIQMLEIHSATIAGILYGHTHMDEVRRIYDSANQKVTEVAISAPGITPQHDNNPGFKTVSYDPASKELVDFVTHYRTPSTDTWNQYSFSEIYGCAAGSNVYECLARTEISKLDTAMNTIFTVKNGAPTYLTGCGIEVRPGQ